MRSTPRYRPQRRRRRLRPPRVRPPRRRRRRRLRRLRRNRPRRRPSRSRRTTNHPVGEAGLPRPLRRLTPWRTLSLLDGVRRALYHPKHRTAGRVTVIHIPTLVDRLPHRYPWYLLDAVIQHEPGRRVVAAKNVTVSEEFFQGHFPGLPTMPGVLMMEALAQASTVLLLECAAPGMRVYLRGVDNAKI